MSRKRLLFACMVFFAFCCILKGIFHFRLDPSADEFTEIDLCPACYGNNLCPQFFHGDVTLIGSSRLKYLQFLNRKNVYYGKLHKERVVLKKLAHNWEISEGDKQLCQQARLNCSCNVSTAIKRLLSNTHSTRENMQLISVLKGFNSSTDLARCPTERLLLYIFDKINTGHSGTMYDEHFNNHRVAEMMYSLFINPEPIILQAFPQSEGWPFPHYKGSCGRIIVEEYVGRPLAFYEDSPWEQRLDLAYQLLQISHLLTDNSLGFALYLTDVNMDNFAVRPDGTLMLIDVENIIIVDRWKIRNDKKEHWNQMHRNKGEACLDCLNFSTEDLCSHDLSDHNYYAVCKGLLAPGAYYSSQGLLHSIPPEVEKRTKLSSLLQECAEPTTDFGRFIVVPKMLQAMKSLL